MPTAVKNGRKIVLFLKDNIPANKQSFTEREVFLTLQGSKTGKPASVKLKIKAGRRKEPMKSRFKWSIFTRSFNKITRDY